MFIISNLIHCINLMPHLYFPTLLNSRFDYILFLGSFHHKRSKFCRRWFEYPGKIWPKWKISSNSYIRTLPLIAECMERWTAQCNIRVFSYFIRRKHTLKSFSHFMWNSTNFSSLVVLRQQIRSIGMFRLTKRRK